MTYEQALAINQNLTPEQVKNDLERYLLRGEAPIVKGVAMAMQALEKQIPKKVELTEDCCICPNCRFDTMGVYDFTDSDTKDPTYCPNCGQALDWGDGE